MSLGGPILVLALTMTLCGVSCKRILCQMVSVETDDGLSGYCCVIFRNASEINLEEEEVKQQILESFRNATEGDISPPLARKEGDGDAVNFPTEDYGEIRFPETSEAGSFAPEDQKVAPEIKTPGGILNVTNSGNKTKTGVGFAVNRNAVDIPETCPVGSEKDVNGDCVPVY